MKSTRDRILHILLVNSSATISEIADTVGINGISVRHHLINLQNEGLIESDEERHGVGRPRFIYRLTEKGLEKFPTNYLRLTNQIISALRSNISRELLLNIFTQIGKQKAEDINLRKDHMSTVEQIDALGKALFNQGYRLTYEHDNQQCWLINHNCPYHQVASENPEICTIDETMFSSVLEKPLVHSECVSRGDQRCSFLIKQQ